MTKRRLRSWVVNSVIGITCIILVGALYFLGGIINQTVDGPINENVKDVIIEDSIPVNKEIEIKVIKPYSSEKVTISKSYYDYQSDEKTQQNSLIYYENIYLQNTGIMYSSDENFSVVSVLKGTIKNITEDDILGNIIEIEHSPNITTYYQSVNDISVKVGDEVTQGQIIAQSGPNNIEGTKEYNLHFQVIKDGKLINPEEFYEYKITENN